MHKLKGGMELDKSLVDVERIKKDLTFSIPRNDFCPNNTPATVLGYVETETTITVPRRYGKFDTVDCRSEGRPVLFNDSVRLRNEKQELFYNKVSDELLLGKSAYAVGGTGVGKTVLSLKILASLGKSTAIVVHKDFLMRQWQERINQFLPGAKVGFCQQKRCDTGNDYDIVICMVQSLCSRDYPEEFYSSFGLVIYDEVHHSQGASTWNSSLYKFSAKQFLMVTATPIRKDGLHKLQYLQVAPPCVIVGEPDLLPTVETRQLTFEYNPRSYTRYGKASWPIMINVVAKDQARNGIIAKDIISAASAGRSILVISERLEQLDILRGILLDSDPELSLGYYIGRMKEKDLLDSSSKQVILSTTSMTAEGLDLPALDTLIIATPRGDLQQAVGRILRKFDGKKKPLVVDYQDKIPELEGVGHKRRRMFRELGFTVNELRNVKS